jgi:hypothetical protein
LIYFSGLFFRGINQLSPRSLPGGGSTEPVMMVRFLYHTAAGDTRFFKNPAEWKKTS